MKDEVGEFAYESGRYGQARHSRTLVDAAASTVDNAWSLMATRASFAGLHCPPEASLQQQRIQDGFYFRNFLF